MFDAMSVMVKIDFDARDNMEMTIKLHAEVPYRQSPVASIPTDSGIVNKPCRRLLRAKEMM